jgi:hypothetical protein
LNVLKSIYTNVSYTIKVNGHLLPSFPSFTGVKQGCVLSPTLFNIFVSDLPSAFSHNEAPILIDQSIPCLMFADDLVLLSTSASGLQSHLDRLQHYCDTWGLDVNLTKTKAIIFNGTGRLEKVDLQFDGRRVDVVKQYRYLGVVFDNSGSLNPAANNLYSRALKALFKIRQVNASSNPRVALSLFNTLVIPIATYCSEIWAAKHAGQIKALNLASVCANYLLRNSF